MAIIPGLNGVAATFPDGFVLSNGTVSAPTIKFADTTTGFYRPSLNAVALASAGVQSFLVGSDGATTIGVSGFVGAHNIHGTILSLNPTAANGATFFINTLSSSSTAASLSFQTAGTDRWSFRTGQTFTTLGAGADTFNLMNASNATSLSVTQAGAVTVGPSTSNVHHVSNGSLGFVASTTTSNAASIYQSGSRLRFNGGSGGYAFQSADGVTSFGLIETTGAWSIGPSSPGSSVLHKIDGYNASTGGGAGLQVFNRATNTGSAAAEFIKGSADTTTSHRLVVFTINNGVSGSGQINANGAGAAAFGTFSDSRLKENVENLPAQLPNILSLRPVEFDYISGGHQIGFIAQEMEQVYPDAIGVEEDTGMLTITGWDKTSARLVKAIQELAALRSSDANAIAELNAKLEAAEARIASLEGN